MSDISIYQKYKSLSIDIYVPPRENKTCKIERLEAMTCLL